MLKFLLAVGLMVLHVELSSQTFFVDKFGIADGLPSSNVVPLLEDQNGYLWVGTPAGLAQFNGKNFSTPVAYRQLHVTALACDAKDNLWIGGVNRIARLNEPNQNEIDSQLGGLAVNEFVLIADTLFFRYGTKLGSIAGGQVLWDLQPDMPVRRIFQHKEGLIIWTAHELFIPNSLTSIPTQSFFGNIFKVIEFGNDPVFSTDQGLFQLQNQNLRRLFPEIKDRVALFDRRDSTFWVAPVPPVSGLKKVTCRAGKLSWETVLNSEYRITYAIADREGDTWFATDNRGLVRIRNKSFERIFPPHRDKSIIISALAKSAGDLWIGTMGDGVHVVPVQGKPKVKTFSGRGQNLVRSIEIDSSHAWIGTYGGLIRSDLGFGETLRWTRENGLPSDSVFALETDPDGLWIGTRGGGLSFFDGTSFSHLTLPDEIDRYYVWSLQRVNGILYVATNRGIFKEHNGKLESLGIDGVRLHNYFSIEGLVLESNAQAADHSQLLLLGSNEKGLGIYDTDQSKVTWIGEAEGLMSEVVYGTLVDDQKHIWVKTNKGLQRIKLGHNLEIVESQSFNSQTGFDGIDANLFSFLQDEHPIFGSVTGLYQFVNSDDGHSFPLHFSGVKLFYGEHELAPFSDSLDSHAIPLHPILPSDENHLTFEFNRVSKSFPQTVRYRYILENFDTRWSIADIQSRVTYSNIPPGKYNFVVQATSSTGRWMDDFVHYPFEIKPPMYATIWFRLLVVGFVILFAALWGYRRARQVAMREAERVTLLREAQEIVRKEMARDFHDELGNQLAKIINHVSVAKLKGPNLSLDAIEKIEEAATQLHRGTRDLLWSLDSGNNELFSVFLYIRDFGEKLFREKQIDFRADAVQVTQPLPNGWGREIILIFKEAMTNAFKHSRCTRANLTLSITTEHYILSFYDDGIGVSQESLPRSGGIANMNLRSKKIGADFSIQADSGTRVSLRFSRSKMV